MDSGSSLVLNSLIPAHAGLGWQLNLFETSTVVSEHYHKLQTQLIMMLEGSALFCIGSYEIPLNAGEMVVLPPNATHKIIPEGRCSFFALDLPGFTFPEDAYFEKLNSAEAISRPFVSSKASVDQQTQIATNYLEQFKIPAALPPNCYQNKIEVQGYTVYEFALPNSSPAWSLALLDLMEAPKHFHKRGYEHFLVVNGELDIALDDRRYVLLPGQSAHIAPHQHYHLKSHLNTPVRLLCVNFPTFDADDFLLSTG